MKLSRRAFSGVLISAPLAVVGIGYVGGATMRRLTQRPRRAEVITYFDGQLWLDCSGQSREFRGPAAAARGAAEMGALSEQELRARYPYI